MFRNKLSIFHQEMNDLETHAGYVGFHCDSVEAMKRAGAQLSPAQEEAYIEQKPHCNLHVRDMRRIMLETPFPQHLVEVRDKAMLAGSCRFFMTSMPEKMPAEGVSLCKKVPGMLFEAREKAVEAFKQEERKNHSIW